MGLSINIKQNVGQKLVKISRGRLVPPVAKYVRGNGLTI